MSHPLFRAIVIVFVLAFNSQSNAQDRIDSLKLVLEKGLNDFIEAKKGVDSLDYIDASFFIRLLDSINPKTTPLLFNIKSFHGVYISLGFNKQDSLFAYSYNNYGDGTTDMEIYYKNCNSFEPYHRYRVRNEKNLVFGLPNCYPLVSIDTIGNVIITKPIKNRYNIETSELVKDSAEERVKESILSKYQLAIYIWGTRVIAHFIAPPSPKSKIKVQVKVNSACF